MQADLHPVLLDVGRLGAGNDFQQAAIVLPLLAFLAYGVGVAQHLAACRPVTAQLQQAEQGAGCNQRQQPFTCQLPLFTQMRRCLGADIAPEHQSGWCRGVSRLFIGHGFQWQQAQQPGAVTVAVKPFRRSLVEGTESVAYAGRHCCTVFFYLQPAALPQQRHRVLE